MSRGDTSSIIKEYREKMRAQLEGAELDSLVNQIDSYMLGVLMGCTLEDASVDRAALETLSECLVRSGLAREAKLEEIEGRYTITVTGHVWGAEAQPDERVDGALGELMQLLVELKTGRIYRVEVLCNGSRAVFRFASVSS